jgi:hypothetical protein
MRHPTDISPAEKPDHPTPGGRAPWWALLVLVVIVTAVVVGLIALSGDNAGESMREPPSTQAPVAPGS